MLTVVGPDTVLADWADAPRAVRYRVFKQVVGVDADFVFDQTVTDSDATIIGLPAGKTVRVRVIAVNAQDEEGPPSAVQEITLPIAPL